MRNMDERKFGLAKRMRDAVANPPPRQFARELLAIGLSANEVYQLVVRDQAFDGVAYAFRVAVANAARELDAQRLLAGGKATSAARQTGHA